MTDPTFDPRDELASAQLDGELTAEEAARATGDPEVARRLTAFDAVRTAVRADVPVDGGRRDAAVAAALAAFDDAAVEGPGGSLTPISAARSGRLRWAKAVGVAAAVALLAAVAPLLLDGDDDADTTATQQDLDDAAGRDRTAAEDAAPLLESEAPAAGSGGAVGDAGTAALSAALPDLGPHADLPSLRAAVQVRAFALSDAPPTDPAVVPSPAGRDCLARTSDLVGATGRTIAYTATAVVAERPVVVVVGVDDAGGRTLVVAEPDRGCATVVDEPL
jgi:hypothetical protein